MLASLDDEVAARPHLYRELYWEAGRIGQALYLAAEACGYRGTGIGCFFDDPVRAFCRVADRRLHTLYHFTVGRPLVDTRLQSRPPYAHLTDERPVSGTDS